MVRFDGDQLPVWHEPTGHYLHPATEELLPAWDEALDAIGPHDEPRHVARFGTRFDAQGVIARSKDAARCIGYLIKYLTKHAADCHHPETAGQEKHATQLADALRYEPLLPGLCELAAVGHPAQEPPPGSPGHWAMRTAVSTSAMPGGLQPQLQPRLIRTRMTHGIAHQLGDQQRRGLVQVHESPQPQRITNPAPRYPGGPPGSG